MDFFRLHLLTVLVQLTSALQLPFAQLLDLLHISTITRLETRGKDVEPLPIPGGGEFGSPVDEDWLTNCRAPAMVLIECCNLFSGRDTQ